MNCTPSRWCGRSHLRIRIVHHRHSGSSTAFGRCSCQQLRPFLSQIDKQETIRYEYSPCEHGVHVHDRTGLALWRLPQHQRLPRRRPPVLLQAAIRSASWHIKQLKQWYEMLVVHNEHPVMPGGCTTGLCHNKGPVEAPHRHSQCSHQGPETTLTSGTVLLSRDSVSSGTKGATDVGVSAGLNWPPPHGLTARCRAASFRCSSCTIPSQWP